MAPDLFSIPECSNCDLEVFLSADSCPLARMLFGQDATSPLFLLFCDFAPEWSSLRTPDDKVKLLAHLNKAYLDNMSFVSYPLQRAPFPPELMSRWPVASFFTLLFASIGWPCRWTLRIGKDNLDAQSFTQVQLASWRTQEPSCSSEHAETLWAFYHDIRPDDKSIYVVLEDDHLGQLTDLDRLPRELSSQLPAFSESSGEINKEACTLDGRARQAKPERQEACMLSGVMHPTAVVSHTCRALTAHVHRSTLRSLAARLRFVPSGLSLLSTLSGLGQAAARCADSGEEVWKRTLPLCDTLQRLWCHPMRARAWCLIDPLTGVVGVSGRTAPPHSYVHIARRDALGDAEPHDFSPEAEAWILGRCGSSWPAAQGRDEIRQVFMERPELFAQCCEAMFLATASHELVYIVQEHARSLLQYGTNASDDDGATSATKKRRIQDDDTADVDDEVLRWTDYRDIRSLLRAGVRSNSNDSCSYHDELTCLEEEAELLDQGGHIDWLEYDTDPETRPALERQIPHLHPWRYLEHEKWTSDKILQAESGAEAQAYRAVFPLYLGRCLNVFNSD
ncbi:unnamed protein product [Parajaminaea phylloscopi]